MQMRTLTSKDLFPLCNIIKKIGIEDFKKCLVSSDLQTVVNGGGENGLLGASIVIDIASIIVSNFPKCENELYDFLASLTGEKRVTLEELPMDDFLALIIDFVKKKEFKDFFSQVSRLLK